MRQDVFSGSTPANLPTDREVIDTVIGTGTSIGAPLTLAYPETIPSYASTDPFNLSILSSAQVNAFFGSSSRDLARLFSAANYNDQNMTALENLGYNELAAVSRLLDKLEDNIKAASDLQIGYNAGYTVYQRSNFITDNAIEPTSVLIGTTNIAQDSESQTATLELSSSRDVLHSAQGTTLVIVNIDEQLGYPLAAYSSIRTPLHAIDNNQKSYWGEVILADSPIEIPWPTVDSTYLPAATAGIIPSITQGAVSEYTINFPAPETFNTIVIEPFSGLPINLAAVFVVKRQPAVPVDTENDIATVDNQYHVYSINEYNSERTNGYLFLAETNTLAFPLQEDVKSITLVFHQPHYTKEVYSLSSSTNQANSLWQQMLGNSPLLGLPANGNFSSGGPSLDLTYDASAEEVIDSVAQALGSRVASGYVTQNDSIQNYVSCQYTYGAYSIQVYDRRYVSSGTLISKKFNSGINLAQGALVDDLVIPFENALIATASWFGPTSFQPTTYQVPAAVVNYDLSYGDSQNWNPLAPINSTTMYEPLIITSPVTQFNLRLQAQPASPIYITSFDGQGNATLLGCVTAPALVDLVPTNVQLPSVELAAPGFYMVEYTPIDTSFAVDFAYFLGPEPASFQKTYVATATTSNQPLLVDSLRGLQLPDMPYIAMERIGLGYDPNGLPGKEYVPITVTINNLPLSFTNARSGATQYFTNYYQDTDHGNDYYVSLPVIGEILNSADINSAAAVNFTTQYSNWDITPGHFPQLYQLAQDGPAEVIPQINATGVANWEFDADKGTITFVNGNAAASGQITISYWYYGTDYAQPLIVNKTNYLTGQEPSLTPFDIQSYPLIEYVQVGNILYFNMDIPITATVTVNYYRLYDSMRLRATFTRVDPVNESATPKLSGFTLLGRDANGTSGVITDNPEVTWADLQYYPLGSQTQVNPLTNLIDLDNNGNATGNSSQVLAQVPAGLVLPADTQFNWYKIVNCGSQADSLRAQYYAGGGTLVYVDLSGAQYIEPDAGQTAGTNYLILASDGSNFITVSPGESILVAIGNTRKTPGTPNSIDPAIIYSAQTPNYLQSQTWLFAASLPGQNASAAQFVIS